ncbi:RHS repeat-associated core domain-containing protein [Jatrophihabitans endophyticus]|uniref:RHS repeat-associated core domain-containing protein n=1 Tax=Jatrophihabitans endophyticus TaxID=1206085 RepID=A0A1M5I9K3_9ACTN|nr:RHS repeat-associated core domain-containing protein [Jatrophihabitans endophyticus]SHG24932.1 RHS repeat-associated core domain-containing protein [Jatrophihabitans endophyticus]
MRSYCYDDNGNRTSRDASSSTTDCATANPTSSFDGANQQLTGPDGANSDFAYDLDGNETSAASKPLTNAYTRATGWSDNQQATTVAVNGDPAASSSYLGASQDTLLSAGKSATSSDTLRNTNLGVTRVTGLVNGATSTDMTVTRDPDGLILSLRDSSGDRYYPLSDNQHSVLRIVNATGNAVDSYSYDPFGVRTVNTNAYPQPFGYTGEYTNPTTGLVHLGARWYDPSQGRFTSTDPETHPGDINQTSPYPYAGNDPINHTDPTGHSFFSAVGDFVGTVGTFAGTGAAVGGTIGLFVGGPPGAATGAVIGGAVGTIAGVAYGIADIFVD